MGRLMTTACLVDKDARKRLQAQSPLVVNLIAFCRFYVLFMCVYLYGVPERLGGMDLLAAAMSSDGYKLRWSVQRCLLSAPEEERSHSRTHGPATRHTHQSDAQSAVRETRLRGGLVSCLVQ